MWYFESPDNWLPLDGVSMYNGSLEFHLITTEWTGSFQSRASDFDLVLVSKKTRLTLGKCVVIPTSPVHPDAFP